jgi:hypothetical protein
MCQALQLPHQMPALLGCMHGLASSRFHSKTLRSSVPIPIEWDELEQALSGNIRQTVDDIGENMHTIGTCIMKQSGAHPGVQDWALLPHDVGEQPLA